MFYYVYILRNQKSEKLYNGFTKDLKKRLFYHSHQMSKFTGRSVGWKLIYAEAYISEKDARKREAFLKTGRGREVIRKQLSDTLAEVAELAYAHV